MLLDLCQLEPGAISSSMAGAPVGTETRRIQNGPTHVKKCEFEQIRSMQHELTNWILIIMV